jgi:hypothetical protein
LYVAKIPQAVTLPISIETAVSSGKVSAVWQTAFPVEDVPDAIAYDQVSWLSPEHAAQKQLAYLFTR